MDEQGESCIVCGRSGELVRRLRFFDSSDKQVAEFAVHGACIPRPDRNLVVERINEICEEHDWRRYTTTD